jgi:hypothetical protein
MPDTQPVDPRVVETVRILHGDTAADRLAAS